MNTQTLVRASADVVTITTLRTGDVYKRLVKNWQGEYDATFGVVQSVDHNGEHAMISSLEIGGSKVDHKVFGTDTDLHIFAATPEEVAHRFDEQQDNLLAAFRAAQDAVQKAQTALDRFHQIRAQVEVGTVQSPAVVRSTTQEITA